MQRIAVGAALSVILVLAGWAAADTEITTFDNFTLDAKFASWASSGASLSSSASRFGVAATGYGSGYKYLGGNIDASGNNTVQLDVTVDAGVAGFVIDISDSNNNGQQYAWYGLTPGGGINGGNEYVLTMPMSSGTPFQGSGSVDWTSVSQMNIGIDPGGFATTPYNVFFNDLSATNAATTPEPAALGTLVPGLLFLARRRRPN